MEADVGVFTVIFLVNFGEFVSCPRSVTVDMLTYEYVCDDDTQTGYCYQAFITEMTYIDAWTSCHSHSMHLTMPKTEHQRDFIAESITGDVKHHNVWIGMTDGKTEGTFVWLDGSLPTSTDWKLNEPKDSKSMDEDCVEIRHDGWNNNQCTEKLQQYICEEYILECETGAPYFHGDKCYQIIIGENKMTDAQQTCTDRGSYLAMPKHNTANNYIHNINYGGIEMWIGITRQKRADTFLWDDGTTVTSSQLTNFLTTPAATASQTEYVYMDADGKWVISPSKDKLLTSLICEKQAPLADCGTLYITNGEVISGTTTVGAVHDVVCNQGYKPQSSTTSCSSDATWTPYPICNFIIDCGTVYITNGEVISGTTTVGAVHDVVCNQGYKPQDTTTSCSSDATWTPYPVCNIIIDCGTLYITNGEVISGTTTVGAVHDVVCNQGYKPQSSTTSCSLDATWTPYPVCNIIIDCGIAEVSNGVTISNNTTEGNIHTVECSYGYKAVHATTTCLPNSTWSPLPMCIADENMFCFCVNDVTEGELEEIVQNLTVDKSQLSKSRRKLTSAYDSRTSSKVMGLAGAGIVFGVLGMIIINDACKFLMYIHYAFKDRSNIIFITNCDEPGLFSIPGASHQYV